jgi:hypothetical protein
MGYSQDTDDLFIYLEPDAYMLHLKAMQSKILPGSYEPIFRYHPFTSFYCTPGDCSFLVIVLPNSVILHNM